MKRNKNKCDTCGATSEEATLVKCRICGYIVCQEDCMANKDLCVNCMQELQEEGTFTTSADSELVAQLYKTYVEEPKKRVMEMQLLEDPEPLRIGIYHHFKGTLYKVMGKATHSETGETMVIYKSMFADPKTYVRPYIMFMSDVDKEKYPEIEQTKRFQWISD